MASLSFSLPTHFSGHKSSAVPRRFSPPCANVETTPLQSASYYELLGVRAGATRQEIKSAYRRMARVLHPDATSAAADEFIRMHEAYATLSDQEKRAAYDSSLFRPRRTQWRSGSPEFTRLGRTWETDQCW